MGKESLSRSFLVAVFVLFGVSGAALFVRPTLLQDFRVLQRAQIDRALEALGQPSWRGAPGSEFRGHSFAQEVRLDFALNAFA